MDKIQRYKSIVSEIMEYIAQRRQQSPTIPPTLTHLIKDEQKGHYLLYFDGWKEASRYYGCSIHVEVRDTGRVWLHHDGTDLIVGQQLLDKGIPKSDLVLGFHSPLMRPDTEFAVG